MYNKTTKQTFLKKNQCEDFVKKKNVQQNYSGDFLKKKTSVKTLFNE